MYPLTTIAVIALGAIVGLLVGLTSVGSGALMTPILLLDFGSVISKGFVVGTATASGTVTKFVASARNYYRNALRTQYLFMIAVTGVPLAAVGAFFSSTLITWNLFSPLLACVLVLAAVAIVVQLRMNKKGNVNDPIMDSRMRTKGMMIGVVVGLIAGLTGVSTGSLLVASLILFLKFPMRTAVGIAVFEGGAILLAATIAQLYLGHVDIPFTGLLILGGVPGILIGSHFKDKVNQRLLGYGIAGVIIFESARTLSSFFFGKSFFIF